MRAGQVSDQSADRCVKYICHPASEAKWSERSEQVCVGVKGMDWKTVDFYPTATVIHRIQDT